MPVKLTCFPSSLQLAATLYDPVANANVDLEFKSNVEAFKSGLELHLIETTGRGESAQVQSRGIHSNRFMEMDC